MKKKFIKNALVYMLSLSIITTAVPSYAMSNLKEQSTTSTTSVSENTTYDDNDEVTVISSNGFYASFDSPEDAEKAAESLMDPTDDSQDPSNNIYLNDFNHLLDKEFEPYYNVAQEGYMPYLAENQNAAGACWITASLTASQSNLIKNNYIDNTMDFSEVHAMWFGRGAGTSDINDPLYNKFHLSGAPQIIDDTKCSKCYGGASDKDATEILSCGIGAVPERIGGIPDNTDWNCFEDFKTLDSFERLRYQSDYLLTQTNHFNSVCKETEAAKKSQDIFTARIKNQLKTTGAMYMTYFCDQSGFGDSLNNEFIPLEELSENDKKHITDYDISTIEKNGKIIEGVKFHSNYNNKEYDYPEKKAHHTTYQTNHAVTLVGWDDNYDKSHFMVEPPENGAWICRNSWGDGWANHGYFYISYYDKSFYQATSFEMVPRDTYGPKIYQYCGQTSSISHNNKGMIASCSYTSAEDTGITAIGFDTNTDNVPYTIDIYTGIIEDNPIGKVLVHSQSGTIDYKGYHVIDLTRYLYLASNTDFSIVITQKANGASFKANYCGTTYSPRKVHSLYASYDCETGERGEFKKIINNDKYSEVNIKAYTTNDIDVVVDSVIDPELVTISSGTTQKELFSILPQTVTINTNVGSLSGYSVDWDIDHPYSGSYDANCNDRQCVTYKGTVIYPNNFTAIDKYAYVTVYSNVNTITDFDNPEDLYFNFGTDIDYIISHLPCGTTITVERNGQKELMDMAFIKWDTRYIKDAYDPEFKGVPDPKNPDKILGRDYVVFGELQIDGLENLYNINTGVVLFVHTLDLKDFYPNLSFSIMIMDEDLFSEEELASLNYKNLLLFTSFDELYHLEYTLDDGTTKEIYPNNAVKICAPPDQITETNITFESYVNGADITRTIRKKLVIDRIKNKEFTRPDFKMYDRFLVSFDTDKADILGNDSLMLDMTENVVWGSLPKLMDYNKQFVCWTYDGKDIYEGDDASWVTSDITLTPKWTDIELWTGQSYNISKNYSNIINANPNTIFRIKVDKKKAITKDANGDIIISNKAKGTVNAKLQYRENHKWVDFANAKNTTIVINKPKLIKKTIKLSQTTTVNANDLLSSMPSELYNNITWDCKNPKKKQVISIDKATGNIKLINKGNATIIANVTRDGIVKTYKFKLKVK